MFPETITQADIETAQQDYEAARNKFLEEAARAKTPDEAAQAGFNLGYSKGYQDGLSQGYAEGVRNE